MGEKLQKLQGPVKAIILCDTSISPRKVGVGEKSAQYQTWGNKKMKSGTKGFHYRSTSKIKKLLV